MTMVEKNGAVGQAPHINPFFNLTNWLPQYRARPATVTILHIQHQACAAYNLQPSGQNYFCANVCWSDISIERHLWPTRIIRSCLDCGFCVWNWRCDRTLIMYMDIWCGVWRWWIMNIQQKLLEFTTKTGIVRFCRITGDNRLRRATTY